MTEAESLATVHTHTHNIFTKTVCKNARAIQMK